jgi:transcriptional regulator with XRE-family HTH domain
MPTKRKSKARGKPPGPLPIGERIKATIREREMSAYAVAKAAGINPAIVLRFLSGERSINLATAEKMAEALDLELTARPPKGE